MPICQKCGEKSPSRIIVNNKLIDIHRRKVCLKCRPHEERLKRKSLISKDIELLKIYVKESISKAQVLKKIGLKPKGSNYKLLDNIISNNNLDTSHFRGQGFLRGKSHGWACKIPLEEILVENSNYGSFKLKNRLIKENYLIKICSSCKLDKWLDKDIPLELHHINGINNDNRLINLALLCPNCHALTDNYRSKNKKIK